jgi:hypothetical protein
MVFVPEKIAAEDEAEAKAEAEEGAEGEAEGEAAAAAAAEDPPAQPGPTPDWQQVGRWPRGSPGTRPGLPRLPGSHVPAAAAPADDGVQQATPHPPPSSPQ